MFRFLDNKPLETLIHSLTLHWKSAKLIALDANYITQTTFKHNFYSYMILSGIEPAIPWTKPVQINTSERMARTLEVAT
jgi:hypothetical protein